MNVWLNVGPSDQGFRYSSFPCIPHFNLTYSIVFIYETFQDSYFNFIGSKCFTCYDSRAFEIYESVLEIDYYVEIPLTIRYYRSRY